MADEDVAPDHGEAGQQPGLTLADKLNRLFALMHPVGEREPSNARVASAIREECGVEISHTYIWMLRNGQRANPTMRHLEGLAWYFGVDPNYFFNTDRAAEIDKELTLLATLRDRGVRNVALRTAGASGPTRQAIERFAEAATEADQQSLWRESPRREEDE